jgi:outer membrane biosynthesis protein TonB
MRTLVLGSLGMVACWTGGGGKPASSDRALEVTDAERIVGRRDTPELAREQAIEQAREAGILGQARPATPPGAPAGPLDRESIRREIRARLKPIRRCYERRLADDETLQGTTKVTFAIGADGRVTSSVAAGFDAAVGTCVAQIVEGIRFPIPAGGGTLRVSYPFAFRPPP